MVDHLFSIVLLKYNINKRLNSKIIVMIKYKYYKHYYIIKILLLILKICMKELLFIMHAKKIHFFLSYIY